MHEPETAARCYGVYPAVVTDVLDPEAQGRVRVRTPWFEENTDGQEMWARLATTFAGADRGTWFLPDPGDEVLIAFEAGDPRRPYVVGALWNGRDAPPRTIDSGSSSEDPGERVIRSRQGHEIVLDDRPGEERVVIATGNGQKIELDQSRGAIRVEDGNGNTVVLSSSGIELTSAGKLTLAGSTIAISAGQVTVDAGMVRCSGVLQSDTLIANSVVGATYTRGPGNLI